MTEKFGCSREKSKMSSLFTTPDTPQEDILAQQKAENDRLEFTLLGVMHSVDKWLEGPELDLDEVNRAVLMREKTLQTVESLTEKLNAAIAGQETLQKYIAEKDVEIERLKSEITEKTKTVFQKTINKILSIDDHYVIIDDEFVPCELTEEVEHLFGMSISGDNEEVDAETDRVVKEMLGEYE